MQSHSPTPSIFADPNPAVSHVMVLPLDPRAAAAVACTTPSATDAHNVDVMELFGAGDPLSDGMCNQSGFLMR